MSRRIALPFRQRHRVTLVLASVLLTLVACDSGGSPASNGASSTSHSEMPDGKTPGLGTGDIPSRVDPYPGTPPAGAAATAAWQWSDKGIDRIWGLDDAFAIDTPQSVTFLDAATGRERRRIEPGHEFALAVEPVLWGTTRAVMVQIPVGSGTSYRVYDGNGRVIATVSAASEGSSGWAYRDGGYFAYDSNALSPAHAVWPDGSRFDDPCGTRCTAKEPLVAGDAVVFTEVPTTAPMVAHVVAYARADGRRLWDSSSMARPEGVPAGTGRPVPVGTIAGKLILAWPAPGKSSPLAASFTMSLQDPITGTVTETFAVPASATEVRASADGSLVVLLDKDRRPMAVLDAKTGRRLWISPDGSGQEINLVGTGFAYWPSARLTVTGASGAFELRSGRFLTTGDPARAVTSNGWILATSGAGQGSSGSGYGSGTPGNIALWAFPPA